MNTQKHPIPLRLTPPVPAGGLRGRAFSRDFSPTAPPPPLAIPVQAGGYYALHGCFVAAAPSRGPVLHGSGVATPGSLP